MAGGFGGLRDLTLLIPSAPSLVPIGGFIGILDLQYCTVQGGIPRRVGALNVRLDTERERMLQLALAEDEDFIAILTATMGLT